MWPLTEAWVCKECGSEAGFDMATSCSERCICAYYVSRLIEPHNHSLSNKATESFSWFAQVQVDHESQQVMARSLTIPFLQGCALLKERQVMLGDRSGSESDL